MARRRPLPTGATLYDFRDLDIMYRLAENTNGGVDTHELADLLGFDVEESGTRHVGTRMAWMHRYGMVAFDDNTRHWSLSRSGRRVVEASQRAPALKVVDKMPDELMVEAMAHVTSRFQRGDTMLGHMLRREFAFGTKRR
jgi:hypothetical protein